MKLGRMEDGELVIIEVTDAEVEQKLAEGYEYIVETDRPSETAICHYERITNGWVQVWEEPQPEEGDK